jgi:hypothetical protein
MKKVSLKDRILTLLGIKKPAPVVVKKRPGRPKKVKK